MAWWALAFCAVYVILVFGVRGVVQRRTSGSSGLVPAFGATSSERVANTLYLVSCGLDLLGPALVLAGRLHPLPGLEHPLARGAGVATFVLAIPAAMLAQRAMGSQWRTAVDPEAGSVLVTDGPFAVVRNPVYTTMAATSVAVALLVPTVIALPAVIGCLAALEIQTRLVEEPHLERVHGNRYREYSGRVGRFLPSIGQRRARTSP